MNLFRRLVAEGCLKAGDTILDLGCGNAKLAIPIVESGMGITYYGVDCIEECIDFGREAFAPYDNAHFGHINALNLFYNPQGDVDAGTVALPFDADSFDAVFAFSLFTHLETAEICRHYVSEVRRVLKPGGLIYSTWFRSPPNPACFEARRTALPEAVIIDLLKPFLTLRTWGGLTTEHHDQWHIIARLPALEDGEPGVAPVQTGGTATPKGCGNGSPTAGAPHPQMPYPVIHMYCAAQSDNYGDRLAVGSAGYTLVQSFEPLGATVRPTAVEEDLAGPSRGVVFGPGTVFLSQPPYFSGDVERLYFVKSDVPFVIYGGVGQLRPEGRELQARLLHRASIVVVRWTRERELLLESFPKLADLERKIVVGGDPGFWEILPLRTRSEERPLVVLALSHRLRDLGTDLYPRLRNGLQQLLQHLAKNDYEAAYFVGAPPDRTVIDELQVGDKPPTAVWDAEGTIERRTLLSNADYVIGSSLHPLIGAARRAVPFLGLTGSADIRWMAADTELEDCIVGSEDCTGAELIRRFERLVRDRKGLQERLRQQAVRMEETSRMGIRRVVEALR